MTRPTAFRINIWSKLRHSSRVQVKPVWWPTTSCRRDFPHQSSQQLVSIFFEVDGCDLPLGKDQAMLDPHNLEQAVEVESRRLDLGADLFLRHSLGFVQRAK